MLLQRIAALLAFSLGCSGAYAGSGFYIAADTSQHAVETATTTELTFTPAPPDPSIQRETDDQEESGYALRFGYFAQRRRTDTLFLAPEFFWSSTSDDHAIYGTSLKIGATTPIGRWYGLAGVARADQFDQNKIFTGFGAEFGLTTRVSINLQWMRLDTIEEQSSGVSLFGSQTLTTHTETKRDIDLVQVGITYYLDD